MYARNFFWAKVDTAIQTSSIFSTAVNCWHFWFITLSTGDCKHRGYSLPITCHGGSGGGIGGISLLIQNLGARWGWVIDAMPWLFYPQNRAQVLIVQEAGWAPGPVWTDVVEKRKSVTSQGWQLTYVTEQQVLAVGLSVWFSSVCSDGFLLS
jgi:hypothetical protein